MNRFYKLNLYSYSWLIFFTLSAKSRHQWSGQTKKNIIKTVQWKVDKVVASLDNAALPQGLDCLWTWLLIAIPNGAGLYLSISHPAVSCFNVACIFVIILRWLVFWEISWRYFWDVMCCGRYHGLCLRCQDQALRWHLLCPRFDELCLRMSSSLSKMASVQDMVCCVWDAMLTVLDVVYSGRVPDQSS